MRLRQVQLLAKATNHIDVWLGSHAQVYPILDPGLLSTRWYAIPHQFRWPGLFPTIEVLETVCQRFFFLFNVMTEQTPFLPRKYSSPGVLSVKYWHSCIERLQYPTRKVNCEYELEHETRRSKSKKYNRLKKRCRTTFRSPSTEADGAGTSYQVSRFWGVKTFVVSGSSS